MTLTDWQSSPKLIGAWRELTESELWKNALSVIDSLSPAEQATRHPADIATTNACILLGQIQGYKWTLQTFKVLSQPPGEIPRQPKPLYGAVLDKGEAPVNKNKP